MKPAWIVLAASALLAGCGEKGREDAESGHAHAEQEAQAEFTSNRVAIPSSVRSNLGIGFVKVERRNVEETLRVPGRFEYMPSARREYRTMLPGKIELAVTQFDRVEAGDLLYTIQSPSWREMQRELAEFDAGVKRAATKLDTLDSLAEAHHEHHEILEQVIEVWEERVGQLEGVRDAGGGIKSEYADAQTSLSSARAELAEVREKHAEILALKAETRAELNAKRIGFGLLIDSAASVSGITREELERVVESDGHSAPNWQRIHEIRVRASAAGVIEATGVTNGSWTDQSSPVVTVVNPEKLRFHAEGMQSDLGVLRDGLAARIVSPTTSVVGRGVDLTQTMSGELRLGLSGHSRDRTIEMYVVPDQILSWARDGVTAQVEIVIDPSAGAELAIPLAAVQRDGLTPVIFRRDPANQNEAIRLEADLGADDGRWIEILSGVREGDEIVLDGAFQLMLATSGTMQKGGHFHADGTFHEGED